LPGGVGSLVVFDGPLDPSWSEHLHLALDDAIFALPDSVERMPLRQEADGSDGLGKVNMVNMAMSSLERTQTFEKLGTVAVGTDLLECCSQMSH